MEVQRQTVLEALDNKNCGYFYEADLSNFSKIPGSPVAYWVSENFIKAFTNGKLLGNLIPVKKGMDTGDNNYFLRMWYEVAFNKIDFINHSKKWIPYNKGGNFRKWFGNNEYLLNWGTNGYELKGSKANIRSEHLYFRNSITWNALSSAETCFRYSLYKGSFDSAGSSMFPKKEDENFYLGLMNTNIVRYFLSVINPTLNYGAGSVAQVPVIFPSHPTQIYSEIVQNNIVVSKNDWDSYETSWDFKKHPLV